MEYFLSFVKTISVLCAFLSAIWLLIPKGGMVKSFKFAIGLFTVAVIVSLILSVPSKKEQTVIKSVNNNAYSDVAIKLDSLSVEYAIGNILNASGIEYEKIELITDISDNGSINIIKAVAELKNESDLSKAASIVLKETGIQLIGG